MNKKNFVSYNYSFTPQSTAYMKVGQW